MFRFNAFIKQRAHKQRLQRHDRRETLNNIIAGKDMIGINDEFESSDEDYEIHQFNSTGNSANSFPNSDLSYPTNYHDDEFDDTHLLDGHLSKSENFTPLVHGSSMSVQEVVRKLTTYFIDFNLNKNAVIRLLRIIKEFLPNSNRLPKTWKSIMKVLGFVPSSTKTFLCFRCFERCGKGPHGQRRCHNARCNQSQKVLKSTQLVEIIHMDIRSQIQTILTRNKNLLNRTDLYPTTDICFGEHYRNLSGESINRITLVVHTDGAPLVKLSKQNLWPCFASLVELPPPVRDYLKNIVVLALWSSTIKPDPNVFLQATVEELKHLIKNGTSIFIDGKEFQIKLQTQCFVSDLPAKALFCRTINFNGYSACSECRSAGEWSSTYNMVLYPFVRNDLTVRTHDSYLNAAKEAQRRSNSKRDVAVDGVKGLSTLFQIFEYPRQIVFDYMHLVCINHVPNLIKRWCTQIERSAISSIDQQLDQLLLPHNLKVAYHESLSNSGQWKARANRVFVLNIGVPLVIRYLPVLMASHFLLYSMAIKILHAPESNEEIDLAEKILKYYCQTAPLVHGPSIELFSLHAHLHLAQQVKRHGGLAHTSASAFESCIRFVEAKAYGSNHLASQIAYWIDLQVMMKVEPVKIPISAAVNEIKWNDSRFAPYQSVLLERLSIHAIDSSSCNFFLRFKHHFITYHTTIYDKPYKCRNYIVSFFIDIDSPVQYGNLILFIRKETRFYALVQQYVSKSKSITDYVDIPFVLHSKAKQLYPLLELSDKFLIISVETIRHKCVSIPIDDSCCLSEIRVDYEHD